MRIALTVVAIGWILGFARGPVRRLLPEDSRDPLTLTLTAGGLGLGAITLWMFWLMVAWPGGPVFAVVFVASAVLVVVDRAVGVTRVESMSPAASGSVVGGSHDPLAIVLVVVAAACSTAIVFDAAYWPFGMDDALALYAPFAKHLYLTRTLPVGDGFYEAYPMLVPMAYAATHWVRGAVDEYLARLVAGLMAVGVVCVTGALGRAMGSRRVGLVASALVALTPVFGRWASSGYTDVPVALYVGLATLFGWRWWRSGDPRAAALTGISAGLAMWTKNDALTLSVSLAGLVLARLVFAWRLPNPRGPEERRRAAWGAALALGSVLLVAGPWYARNLLLFGFLVPPTAWIDRAPRGLASFLTMLRGDHHFGMSGWLFTAAVPYGLARLAWGRGDGTGRWHLLLAVAAPFLAAWWWLASYEARFLMAMLPVLATMSGLMLAEVAEWWRPYLTAAGSRRMVWAAAVVALVATPVALRKSIEHKSVLLRTPFPGDAERHRVRLGGLYELATALNGLPSGSRVAGVPSIIRYHLEIERFAAVDWARQTTPPETLAPEYDYVVYRDAAARTCLDAAASALLHTDDGYLLCRTTRAGVAKPDGAGPKEGSGVP